MAKRYAEDLKMSIIRSHIEDGRTLVSLSKEYNISKAQREIEELKKSSGILCKGDRLSLYRFIDANKEEFGLRWLLRRMKIYPNAYYNFPQF